MKTKKIIVFSGAGMSAESGIRTFRDTGGLWEEFRIEEVATPQAFASDPEKVLRFYNMRFQQLKEVEPNRAHYAVAELEADFDVEVITQNVDNLHERAGSSRVLHLHGELAKCRSSVNKDYIIPMPEQGLAIGDSCPDGHQLRPHIVWFGELVPAMVEAEMKVQEADILIVIGTSLNVYPAAGLAYAAQEHAEVYLIDPGEFELEGIRMHHIKEKASRGIEILAERLKSVN
jgi:NAD-dependent deacetylase